MSEIVKNPAIIIIFVIALAVVLVMLSNIVYGVKIGRGSCILISNTIRSALSPLVGGFAAGFHPVCDLMTW